MRNGFTSRCAVWGAAGMVVAASSLSAAEKGSEIPAYDGPVRTGIRSDLQIDSFETAQDKFGWRTVRGPNRGRAEVRDGISAEGQRSLHVELNVGPDVKDEVTQYALDWKLPSPQDMSSYDAFVLAANLMTPYAGWMKVVLHEDNGTGWLATFQLDPARIGVWQTVSVPLGELLWFHETPSAPDGRTRPDLRRVKRIQLWIPVRGTDPVTLDLDGVGFVRKVATYEGLCVKSFEGTAMHWQNERAPYELTAHVAGRPSKNMQWVKFHLLDYLENRVELLKEVPLPPGTTNRLVKLTVPYFGLGYRKIVGTVYDETGALYRTSRGLGSVEAPEPARQERNPESIFGTWVGGDWHKVGAKWHRHGFRGHQMGDAQPARGELPPDYIWGNPITTRRIVKGMDAYFCFNGTPKWLTSAPSETEWWKFPPKDWGKYRNYVEWLVDLTKDYGFSRYEIWNEPVPWAGWRGDVPQLVKLAEETYKGIKAVKPDAQVLGPCGYSFLPEFTESFFRLGGTNWIDGVVVHGYTPAPPDKHFVDGIRQTKALMRKYGLGNRELHITEWGYATPEVTEEDQAAFLVRGYVYAMSEGVMTVIWHAFRSYLPHQPRLTYELMGNNDTPRPGAVAYATMTRLLEGARFDSSLGGLADGQVGFRLVRGNATVTVLWSKTAARGAAAEIVRLPVKRNSTVSVVDLLGREVKRTRDAGDAVSVAVTRDPVYVVVAAADLDAARERLADEIAAQVMSATAFADGLRSRACAVTPVGVRKERWTEVWPKTEADVARRYGAQLVTNAVEGEVWSDAIDAALAKHPAIRLPARKEPYYIDRPIVLASGQAILAAGAEIRLKPNTRLCMLRNRTVVGMTDQASLRIPDVPYDRGILVEGGVWHGLKTAQQAANGNARGDCAKQGNVHGCYGAFVFNHVDGLVLRDVTVGGCQTHALQLSDVRRFRVERIAMRAPARDGVHLHGGCDWGWVSGVTGQTYDDFVAINAWDWANTSPVVGPIHHLLVEDVVGSEGGTRDIRLLPGNRKLKDGSGGTRSCEIRDVVLKNLTNIRFLKAYDQPNLEMGRDKDRSEPIGTMRNVFVSGLNLSSPCCIEIDDHVDGFDISNVRLATALAADEKLVVIGPKTGKWGKVEIFSPDEDIVVRDFTLRDVRVNGKTIDPQACIRVSTAGRGKVERL